MMELTCPSDLEDLNNKSLSKNPNTDFIPIALSNGACFHVLMATLLQYQRFQGAQGGACFWYHRGAAITALNQELASEDAQITDTMFFTVVMLLYVEVLALLPYNLIWSNELTQNTVACPYFTFTNCQLAYGSSCQIS
jgi:hypothetical protein